MPPCIIHSRQAEASRRQKNAKCVSSVELPSLYSEHDTIDLSPRFSVGLSDPTAGPQAYTDQVNPFGFSVRATANGSMTQDTFYDYCSMFVKNLPDDQGPGGKPVIILFDGHSSRWNLAALDHLTANNVYPFFFPSHTSVWTQPNDNGANLRFHKCVENAIKRLRGTGNKNTVWFYNTVIRWAWADFLELERMELLNAHENSTTSAYRVCGFAPFDPDPDAWRQVLMTLGKNVEEMKKDSKTGKKRKQDDEVEY